jgi:hypothetical protein
MTAGERLPTPAERYRKIVDSFAADQDVEVGDQPERPARGFGSSALRCEARIFAFLSSREEFIVKLPRQRIDALVSSGAGKRWDAGKGRPLKEWLAVSPGSENLWSPLARDALAFARSTSGKNAARRRSGGVRAEAFDPSVNAVDNDC